MAIKYFVEADEDLEMDVQVGPQEEIEAAPDDKASEIADPVVPEVKEEEGVQLNPVEIAKKSPETVCVGCKIENVDDKEIREFYVDARDVEKYADLNEKSFLESLNDIILANEGSGMGADNIVVVMDESTSCYTRTLEKNGAACVFVNEAVEDIEMDVQVGPDKEEESVKADPQEANPVDAVKRQYGSVVVANQGDEFFMDVEDVQKCAELNCESVIKTLNGIIDVNEQFDMNTENVIMLIGESVSPENLVSLSKAGVLMEAKFTFWPKLQRDPDLAKYTDDLKEAEALCKEKNIETKTGALNACRVALRILDIYYKVGSVVCIPAVIFVVPYLMIRGFEWLAANGEESVAKAQGKKVIEALDKAIAAEKDKEAKQKLQDTKEKVIKSMSKVSSAFEKL